jgi:hypothetical protein
MPEPDLEGFAAAQRGLREKLGRRVTFWHSVSPEYPPATPSGAFDPETGFPYDPVNVVALNEGAMASASAMCSVVFAPAIGIAREHNQEDALGLRAHTNLDLIIGMEDVAAASGAAKFVIDDIDWAIYDLQPDGIGALQRYVVYGRRG